MAGHGPTSAEHQANLRIAATRKPQTTPRQTETQVEDQKRDKIIDAVADKVRDEIQFAFGSDDSRAMATGVSIEKFLEEGATLVGRNPVDPSRAGHREYVLANRRITEIGTAAEVGGEENGNVEESQNPLDTYMNGLRVLLKRALKEIETKNFGAYEMRVVATDTSSVEEGQRNRVEIHDNLDNFNPPEVASEGTR